MALGHSCLPGPICLHDMDAECLAAVVARHEGDVFTIRRPRGHHSGRELPLAGPVGPDHVKAVRIPGTDLRAVGRPHRVERVEVVLRDLRHVGSIDVHRIDVHAIASTLAAELPSSDPLRALHPAAASPSSAASVCSRLPLTYSIRPPLSLLLLDPLAPPRRRRATTIAAGDAAHDAARSHPPAWSPMSARRLHSSRRATAEQAMTFISIASGLRSLTSIFLRFLSPSPPAHMYRTLPPMPAFALIFYIPPRSCCTSRRSSASAAPLAPLPFFTAFHAHHFSIPP